MKPSNAVLLNNPSIDQSTLQPQASLPSKVSLHGTLPNAVWCLMTSDKRINQARPTQEGPLDPQLMMRSFVRAQKHLLETRPSSSSDPHLKAFNVLESRGFQPKRDGLEIPLRANGLLGGMRPQGTQYTARECEASIARDNALISQLNIDLENANRQLATLSARLERTEDSREWGRLKSEISDFQLTVRTLETSIVNAGNRVIYFQQQNQNLR